VETAARGDRGGELALSNAYDLIVLDIDLPGRSGLEILADLRDQGREVPVLLLTIQSGENAVAEGLDTGADDYLSKPFSLLELKARCRALLRRGARAGAGELSFGDVTLDRDGREVEVAGEALELPSREFDLLHALIRSPGRVISHDQLLARVWGIEFDPGTNRVRVTVSRLRRSLEKAGSNIEIKTVRGRGFRLEHEVEGPAS
jgi:DNA-binding response OmpR family regulator